MSRKEVGFFPLALPLSLQPWKGTYHPTWYTHTPTGERPGPLTDPRTHYPVELCLWHACAPLSLWSRQDCVTSGSSLDLV